VEEIKKKILLKMNLFLCLQRHLYHNHEKQGKHRMLFEFQQRFDLLSLGISRQFQEVEANFSSFRINLRINFESNLTQEFYKNRPKAQFVIVDVSKLAVNFTKDDSKHGL
jgi:hypothetical protein